MQWTKFAVYDAKVQSSHLPWYAPTRSAGLRTWHFMCNKEGNEYNNYPADYTLFELAYYETDTMDEQTHDQKIDHGLAQNQIGKEI